MHHCGASVSVVLLESNDGRVYGGYMGGVV
jgi:hypothetical protein